MRALWVVLVLIAAPALAEDSEVLQIKQAFEPGALEVAAGTTVTFSSADDVNHNLKTVAPDGTTVDRGVEKPGESTQILFATAGVYSVICGIHPRMKMRVTVR